LRLRQLRDRQHSAGRHAGQNPERLRNACRLAAVVVGGIRRQFGWQHHTHRQCVDPRGRHVDPQVQAAVVLCGFRWQGASLRGTSTRPRGDLRTGVRGV
ncbi:uncharacterized protein METZ01_LOCUS396110, partial [marine metagenome]